MTTGQIRLKSINDPAEPEDGMRILITRWRPRAFEALHADWNEDLAPSASLLLWGKRAATADPAGIPGVWDAYRERFLAEMRAYSMPVIRDLANCIHDGATITLICYCRDEEHCHRSLVRELIMGEVGS